MIVQWRQMKVARLAVQSLIVGCILASVACKTQPTIPPSNSASSSSSQSSSSNSQSSSSVSSSSSSSRSSPGGTSSSTPGGGGSFPSSSGFPSSQGQSGQTGSSGSSSSVSGENAGPSESSGENTVNSAPEGGYSEVLSDEEYVAVLEGELDASAAVFDGIILEERNTVEAIEGGYSSPGFPDGEQEEGEGGPGDGPLFEEGDLSADAGEGVVPPIPGEPAQQSGDSESDEDVLAGQSGDEPSTSSDGGLSGDKPLPGGGAPDDIGDGRDDDIVARQIREAALKETDPVLQEKLWEEYRKYKNQSK